MTVSHRGFNSCLGRASEAYLAETDDAGCRKPAPMCFTAPTEVKLVMAVTLSVLKAG